MLCPKRCPGIAAAPLMAQIIGIITLIYLQPCRGVRATLVSQQGNRLLTSHACLPLLSLQCSLTGSCKTALPGTCCPLPGGHGLPQASSLAPGAPSGHILPLFFPDLTYS